jgi:type IV pilus assembly protein PilA
MRFRRDEGFTLVELMVVVLIIGILVAIAIPVFNVARARAQERSCFANQRTVEGAAQTYVADSVTNALADLDENPMTGGNPLFTDGDGDGAGDFVAELPVCPTTAPGSYSLASGVITCVSSGHAHY